MLHKRAKAPNDGGTTSRCRRMQGTRDDVRLIGQKPTSPVTGGVITPVRGPVRACTLPLLLTSGFGARREPQTGQSDGKPHSVDSMCP